MNKIGKKDNTYCCVPQCTSRGSKNPELSFHLFPNEKSKVTIISANGNKTLVSRKGEWKRVLRIGKDISSRMTVCSKHFTQEDYLTTSMSQRARLKPYAVPSCFLPVLSTEKIENNLQKSKATEDRQLRYGEINRKRDNNVAQCSSLSKMEEKRNSGHSEEENIQDLLDAEEISGIDTEAERLAVKALLGMSDTAPNNVERLSGISNTLVNHDKGTQVVSGDLKLPYLIEAEKLTDKQLKSLTGLQSLSFLNMVTNAVREEIKMSNKHKLPLKEKLILVFMKIKLNISFSCLAIFFGCTVKTTCNIFSTLVPILASLFESLIVFLPKDVILANMPKCFKGFRDVRIVLDCTEIYVQKPKFLNERILTYSQYKSGHTLKYLIGISPGGLITFVSTGYGGRATDKNIFEDSKLIEMLEPCSDAIMADKGFLIDEVTANYNIKLIRPPFLKQKRQFSSSEANLCKKIARARVHVERTIERIKQYGMLKSAIAYNLVHLMDQIMIIIAGLTNLSPSILQDDKF